MTPILFLFTLQSIGTSLGWSIRMSQPKLSLEIGYVKKKFVNRFESNNDKLLEETFEILSINNLLTKLREAFIKKKV